MLVEDLATEDPATAEKTMGEKAEKVRSRRSELRHEDEEKRHQERERDNEQRREARKKDEEQRREARQADKEKRKEEEQKELPEEQPKAVEPAMLVEDLATADPATVE